MVTHSLYDWIGLSLATALGGAGAGYYLIRVISGSLAKRWPAITGRVTSSKVEQTPGRLGPNYQPRVEYEYAVAGVSYTGNQRRFDDDDYALRSSATQRLAGYAPGASITVYYDPDDPTCSVLEPGSEWRTYTYILSLGALFITCLLALLGYLQ